LKSLTRSFCFAIILVLAATVSILPVTAQTQLPPVFTSYDTVKLADGIYAFISPEATGGFVSGNSVLIIGSDGALVVDSGHVPSLTKRMIADITKLTNKPVRFVVNTHWHPDHVSGNSLYHEQWPGVAIVSTPGTQFELTRPDPLYDDLTEINKYMPVIEKALASGNEGMASPLAMVNARITPKS
jgi:glyoxylase-like metal-dependent hydrolase (beta-lactamase superfamily II)